MSVNVRYWHKAEHLLGIESDPDEAINRADDLTCATVVAELWGELRRIVIPEAADAQAGSDQRELIERFGGRKTAFRIGAEGATPAPTV
jgi:choline-sulfatase